MPRLENLDLISIDDLRSLGSDQVGGKAAALAVLRRHGVRVPSGFAIPTAVTRGLLDRAAQTHGSGEAPAGLPAGVQVSLAAAASQLGDWCAVRSSAVHEDSATTSFAGQFLTRLDVRPGDVGRCVSECLAQSRLYVESAAGQTLAWDPGGMAVLVQQMIVPTKSGVLFTGGSGRNDGRLVIEATRGACLPVVGGSTIPDTHVVERAGIVVMESVGRAPVLERREIRRLIELGSKVEEIFGCPQDIEWALVGDVVTVLQSRPITARWSRSSRDS